MKLVLKGHNERYTVEQSLMNLFPGELPVYEPIAPGEDGAVVSCREDGDSLTASTALTRCGKTVSRSFAATLSGTAFDREGQRRHAIAAGFYLAALEFLEAPPPWGMLTGVRPDKPAAWAVGAGKSRSDAQRILEETYFVSSSRAALAAVMPWP